MPRTSNHVETPTARLVDSAYRDRSAKIDSTRTPSCCATSSLIAAPGEISAASIVWTIIERGSRPRTWASCSASTSPRPCELKKGHSASSGSGQINDRINPGRPDGVAASITIAASCPFRHSSSSMAAAKLDRGYFGWQPREQQVDGRPADLVVAVRASEAHDQAHDPTILSFNECVAQLMHGS